MIPNDVTNETAHFTNWLLYSPFVKDADLREACRAAEQAVENEVRRLNAAAASATGREADRYDGEAYFLSRGYGRDRALNEKVGCAMRDAFANLIAATLPGDHVADRIENASRTTPLWDGVLGHHQSSYESADPTWMLWTLMGATLERIEFVRVGEFVRDHVAESIATV